MPIARMPVLEGVLSAHDRLPKCAGLVGNGAKRKLGQSLMVRKLLPVVLFVVGGILLYVYFQTKLPPGFESKGPTDWMQIISLVSAIVSIVSGVITTTIQVMQHRKR